MPVTQELNYLAPLSGTVRHGSPRLDLARLESVDRDAAIEAARRAIDEDGFLLLQLQPSEKASLLTLQQTMREFFAEEAAEKERYRDNDDDCGWMPSLGEPAYQPGTVANVESFDVSPALVSSPADSHWPPDGVLRDQVRDVWSLHTEIGNRVLELIARAMNMRPEFLTSACSTQALNTLRLLHYPGDMGPWNDAEVGIAAHTDFECITLLYQSAPGLEVRRPDGQWLDVPADPGTMIVMFGDMLERWTNGQVQATGHRVRRTAERRFSMAMFLAANEDLTVRPLSEFSGPDNPPRYEPVEQAAHIEREMARARALRTSSPET